MSGSTHEPKVDDTDSSKLLPLPQCNARSVTNLCSASTEDSKNPVLWCCFKQITQIKKQLILFWTCYTFMIFFFKGRKHFLNSRGKIKGPKWVLEKIIRLVQQVNAWPTPSPFSLENTLLSMSMVPSACYCTRRLIIVSSHIQVRWGFLQPARTLIPATPRDATDASVGASYKSPRDMEMNTHSKPSWWGVGVGDVSEYQWIMGLQWSWLPGCFKDKSSVQWVQVKSNLVKTLPSI